MHDTDDITLLRQFVEDHSEEAFATLIQRHVNLVYSVALRRVDNRHQAEEVVQAVYIILARKAADLRHGACLPSWLFQTTRLTAANFMRSEIRRVRREKEAHEMQSLLHQSEAETWHRVAPLLDSLVDDLGEKDRRAILLRFFEGKSLREVGVALGTNEDAAYQRVTRAVDRLRELFSKRGVVLPAAALSATMAANAMQAAPVGLAGAVFRAGMKGEALSSDIQRTVNRFFNRAPNATRKMAFGVIAVLVFLALIIAVISSHQPAVNAPTARNALAVEPSRPSLPALRNRQKSVETAETEIPGKPTFHGLGDLPGGEFDSYALAVSANGKVVVGTSRSATGSEAFRWTMATGMVGLGTLPGDASSRAEGVSGTGNIIVGASSSASHAEAFRWEASTGMVGLGHLQTAALQSQATAISANGEVIVGESSSILAQREAFRWSETTGMVGLGGLPRSNEPKTIFLSTASAVSADGTVVTGQSRVPNGIEAFRWSEETGLAGLGDFPGGRFCSNGHAVSPDGSMIVGFGCPGTFSSSTQEAFRWTADTGLVELGFAPSQQDSVAHGVSANGKIIVGDNVFIKPGFALIWTEENGMRLLRDVLVQDYGLDLSTWQLTSARAMTPDGNTIVGMGINPDGKNEGWMVNGLTRHSTRK